jgi:hypothetical protein
MVYRTCTKIQAWWSKAMSDTVCNPFIKRTFRLGLDVSIGFCGLDCVGLHRKNRAILKRRITIFTKISIARISTGTIYKLWFIGLSASLLPFGMISGVLAMFGYNTVKWNGQPVYGLTGLIGGPLIGVLVAVFFTVFLGSAAALGLWLFSKYKPISIAVKGDLRH